jgi:formylglycine-generating enzyme required for sulfatase activity
LNGGNGLAASGGGYETGWDAASWNTTVNFPADSATWDAHLGTASPAAWTPIPTPDSEKRAMNFITWFDAAAFCIWDAGFLPSEAEWNYAAAAGNQQRVYPWSTPANSTLIDNTYLLYRPGLTAMVAPSVGTKSPKGDGYYGQSDLAGNVWEWNLDWYAAPYAETTCTNCAYVTRTAYRVIRGGAYDSDAPEVTTGWRNAQLPVTRNAAYGARCARTAP